VQFDTPFLTLETFRGVPPVTATVQSCARPLPAAPLSDITRLEVNAMVFPSGDHRGEPADQPSSTSILGAALPSVGTIQIDGTRLFRARSIRDDTYATWLPSGEIRGSAANTNAK
jgi:hypothetical protein